jgi:RNA polymerase sigma-70 factor (ECF subfamily)
MREEGLNYTEIASALDLSVASVGTTLARARKRLVEAYEALQRDGWPDGGARATAPRGEGTHAAS